jgi:hypothetical protein
MGHDDISKDKNAIHYKLSNKFELIGYISTSTSYALIFHPHNFNLLLMINNYLDIFIG